MHNFNNVLVLINKFRVYTIYNLERLIIPTLNTINYSEANFNFAGNGNGNSFAT